MILGALGVVVVFLLAQGLVVSGKIAQGAADGVDFLLVVLVAEAAVLTLLVLVLVLLVRRLVVGMGGRRI